MNGPMPTSSDGGVAATEAWANVPLWSAASQLVFRKHGEVVEDGNAGTERAG